MTDGDRLLAFEAREAIFARDGWLCQNCGQPIRLGSPQLAHRIPQSKMYLKRYSAEIIHHPDNLASVCSLACNDALDIRGHPLEVAALVEKISSQLRRNA